MPFLILIIRVTLGYILLVRVGERKIILCNIWVILLHNHQLYLFSSLRNSSPDLKGKGGICGHLCISQKNVLPIGTTEIHRRMAIKGLFAVGIQYCRVAIKKVWKWGVDSVKCDRTGRRVWKACSVIHYSVSKDEGLTWPRGTVLDRNILIMWSITYAETWNLRAG